MEKIRHYDGLYGDLSFRRRNDYVFLEMIETRSAGFDWIIDSHIHSHLYQFFMVDSGRVEFRSNSISRQVPAPCIFIIPPNTLHGLHYTADVKGRILTLSDAVVESCCREAPAILVGFETLRYLWFNDEQAQVYQKIASVLSDIDEELFTSRLGKETYLNACFLRLFIYLLRVFEINLTSATNDTNTTLKHFNRFQQIIKKLEVTESIPVIAKEMGITAVHLNRICKQVAGKSALLLVQENKIEQAKNYLTHTSYSVSEIAYQLNFEYPNYFARLFRKLTGLTPTEFRNEGRG